MTNKERLINNNTRIQECIDKANSLPSTKGKPIEITELDESLLVTENEGKVYKCDGKLYQIVGNVPSIKGATLNFLGWSYFNRTEVPFYVHAYGSGVMTFDVNNNGTNRLTRNINLFTNKPIDFMMGNGGISTITPNFFCYYIDETNFFNFEQRWNDVLVFVERNGETFTNLGVLQMTDELLDLGIQISDFDFPELNENPEFIQWALENDSNVSNYIHNACVFRELDSSKPIIISLLDKTLLIEDNIGKTYKIKDNYFIIKQFPEYIRFENMKTGTTYDAIPYLTFSSPSTFTLNVVDNTKYWDGELEYSTDTQTWNTWDGTDIINSSSDGKLYMRGVGNTYITGSSTSATKAQWVLTGTNIDCIGNIETLLDYQTVLNGEHPLMGECCYNGMFTSCSSLTTAPELPAITLTRSCYLYMFNSCSSLTTAPELPATVLAEHCYRSMFAGCTSLTKAPALPATILADTCYDTMFYGCTSLTKAPKLPATTLAKNCYYYMFSSCTSLTTAPELPATKLAEGCYQNMFRACSALTLATALPATTLAKNCYTSMFYGCTSLITAPELPATTLAISCYSNMFNGCTKIKLSTTQTSTYKTAYRIPTSETGTTATSALTSMFTGTGGTFTGTPSINTTYYTSNTVV